MEFKIEIDIHPEQEEKLREALENFCYENFIRQPVLKQCSVSRSTWFTTDNTLYAEHHREEAERLRDVLIRKGFKSCGIGNAEGLWSKYSDSYAAGWLGMPDEDDKIFECVQPYIRKFVYCD